MPQLFFPLAHVRLADGDRRFARREADRQDLVSLRVGVRHHLGDRGEIDLERVDVQVGQPLVLREPLGERFEVKQLLRVAGVLPFLVRDNDERVDVAARGAPVGGELVGSRPRNEAVRDEIVEDLVQGEGLVGAVGCGFCGGGHGELRLDYIRQAFVHQWLTKNTSPSLARRVRALADAAASAPNESEIRAVCAVLVRRRRCL
jgi:hypothetical protein